MVVDGIDQRARALIGELVGVVSAHLAFVYDGVVDGGGGVGAAVGNQVGSGHTGAHSIGYHKAFSTKRAVVSAKTECSAGRVAISKHACFRLKIVGRIALSAGVFSTVERTIVHSLGDDGACAIGEISSRTARSAGATSGS